MAFFSYNVLNVDSLECVSINNQEYKIKSIKRKDCTSSCNFVKNINVKVLNLMSRTNETTY